MTSLEKRATLSLASIYALRMLGLFMILPVLSLFAEDMEGATPVLIGLAISVYGLTQALLQIPFGLLSDRFGRKKIIIIGLILFSSGSIVAAVSTTIYGVLLGRAIQGAGAIAAAIMALVADLTQEVHRTKAMATIGASIGVSFGIAITLGPIIAGYVGISGIFWLTGGLSLLAILVVLFIVPNPKKSIIHRDAEMVPGQFFNVLKNPDLLRLDYGIFVLHLCLTASFVVLPLLIRDVGLAPEDHWMVYLPILITSMAMIVPFVIIAEKKRKMKMVFVGAIITLMLANLGLFLYANILYGLIGFLWLFFCGFNLLEATLPSLISKTAPGDLKGTAMGAYSSSQFMGAFVGGAVGGWLYGELGGEIVFLLCAGVTASWAIVALFMNPPNYLANMLISLEGINEAKGEDFVRELLDIGGVEEVRLHFEESVAYLKVDNKVLQKEQLQQMLDQWAIA
jgi:MFS family permease